MGLIRRPGREQGWQTGTVAGKQGEGLREVPKLGKGVETNTYRASGNCFRIRARCLILVHPEAPDLRQGNTGINRCGPYPRVWKFSSLF